MAKPVPYMGLPLKNPVIAAAGPWSCDHAAIQRAIDAGAGAVVTETITLEGSGIIYPRRLDYRADYNFEQSAADSV